jgi:hypothetical protein
MWQLASGSVQWPDMRVLHFDICEPMCPTLMSGYSHRACRIDYFVSLTRYFCMLLVAALVAGCSTFREQPPAPIIEGTVQPVPMPVPTPESIVVEPAVPPSAPAVKPEAERAPARKPHRAPPRFVPPEPPPPPPEVVPPPLIASRLLYPGQVKGLLNTDVQRPDGKSVGRAVDLLTDVKGTPRDLVVNLTGFMGVGDRKVNFPPGALRVTPGAQRAVGALQIVPTRTPPIDPTKPAQGATPPGMVPVMDANVQRPNGDKIGRIVDVLIDASVQPQAAVIDLGNLISPDRRRIAVEWPALHFTMKDKDVLIQLDFSPAQLNASPPYAADQPIHAVAPPPAAPPPVAAANAASAAGVAGAGGTARAAPAASAAATGGASPAPAPAANTSATSRASPPAGASPPASAARAAAPASRASR